MKTLALLTIILALSLAGCMTDGTIESLAPVCTALGNPIAYNSKNKNSDYHAGPKLAPRLKKHNQTGQNLSCPQYR